MPDTRLGSARETAPLVSPRPSMTPKHSPKRFTLCPHRGCRRHRRCVVPAGFCANKRWPLPRTHAQQDAALARIERLVNEALREHGMPVR